jgi:large subunit ribosomal protein L9
MTNMQVILLEKVHNLGALGDAVKVRPGYARNFLIPKGKAVLATARNRAAFELRRAELEREQARIETEARARAANIDGVRVVVTRRAGDGGRLFGSVGPVDVAQALTEAAAPVQRSEVRMPADTIRQLGEYAVEVQFDADVVATVTLVVEAQE